MLTSNVAGIGACEAKKQSECEAAYQRLVAVQDELSMAIAKLSSRLAPVLADQACQSGATPVGTPVSEVHGWLINAEDRTYALLSRVRDITSALTI